MVKIDRALQEVWDWKDEMYRLNKGRSVAGLVDFIKREAASVRSTRAHREKKNGAKHAA